MTITIGTSDLKTSRDTNPEKMSADVMNELQCSLDASNSDMKKIRTVGQNLKFLSLPLSLHKKQGRIHDSISRVGIGSDAF